MYMYDSENEQRLKKLLQSNGIILLWHKTVTIGYVKKPKYISWNN